ncbi:MAG: TonB-dependent receptor, partial [Gemmatimonadota bacterium]|nr:TonB-dependent receptor [Gemmatimonadota bacterium]
YLLRTGVPIVDRSTVVAAQAQYAFAPVERLDLTTGVDYSLTTPKTEGTINGSNEDSDETTEVGAYLSARFELAEPLDLVAALRMDDHQHLENQVWSPRVGLVYEPLVGQSFRATYNRAFSTPTSNNLFLDLSAATIPIIPGVSYDIRTLGVPESGLTWTNQCAGGVSNYCMYSPFAPGVQLPATGAALWDGVVVEGLLADPAVVAALGAMGLDSAGFRAAVGGPTPADVASVLRRFNHENASFPLDPGVTALERIRPTITTTYEVGYQGLVAERVRLSVSVYRSEIRDFVGPLRVETPSVFLDGLSVANYVATSLITAGVAPADAASFAQFVAPDVAMIPLGTVAPDQRNNSALILTYRNFGDVEFWGADLGFEAAVTQRLSALGSYSWVSKECFDFNSDGLCSSSADIGLNAPTHKGSFGLRFSDRGAGGSGIEVGARARYSGDFPMNSGVYVGDIDSYTVLDANAAYEVPGWEGLIVSLAVNNVFDDKHREIIGAPEMGMVALLQLKYGFGG